MLLLDEDLKEQHLFIPIEESGGEANG